MTLHRRLILKMLSVGLATLTVSSIASSAETDEPGLIGHWKLSGDVKDYSPQANHGSDRGVDLKAIGLDGKAGSAAGFDGRGSHIEIASSKSCRDIRGVDCSALTTVETAIR